MKNKKSYAFLGVGNMASAIIKTISNTTIYLNDCDKSKYSTFSGENYIWTENASEAALAADYIILSVKPQNFPVLLTDLKNNFKKTDSKKTFVSIAAGIPIDYIKSYLGEEIPVIRVMPNTPLMIGRGVSALSRCVNVSDEAFGDIMELFSASGRAFELPEDKMNAVISLNGSSPAYVYLFISAMAQAAEKLGIKRYDILDIVCDIVSGSAEMMRNSGMKPDELIKIVASKGGTTEQAMKILYERDLSGIIFEAMEACTERADELSEIYK